MNCPYCGADSSVIDSRTAGLKIRRRRKCKDCSKRFTTYELCVSVILEASNTLKQVMKLLDEGDILDVGNNEEQQIENLLKGAHRPRTRKPPRPKGIRGAAKPQVPSPSHPWRNGKVAAATHEVAA